MSMSNNSRTTEYRRRKRKIDSTAESLKKICFDETTGARSSKPLEDAEDKPPSQVGPVRNVAGSSCRSDLDPTLSDYPPQAALKQSIPRSSSDRSEDELHCESSPASAGSPLSNTSQRELSTGVELRQDSSTTQPSTDEEEHPSEGGEGAGDLEDIGNVGAPEDSAASTDDNMHGESDTDREIEDLAEDGSEIQNVAEDRSETGDDVLDNGNEDNAVGVLETNFSFKNPKLRRPVNFYRNFNVLEVMLLDLAKFIRHNQTYENLLDEFLTKNILFGAKYLPTSKKEIWAVLNKNQAGIQKIAYCRVCHSNMGIYTSIKDEADCPKCNTFKKKNIKYFVTLSLRKQLEHFLNIPGMADMCLQYRANRQKQAEPDSVEDILDGELYRNMQDKGVIGQSDLTFVFNTDGFRVGGQSAWPLFIRLNEIPPNLRQKHRFLAGLWVDRGDPNFHEFLKVFVEECNDLSSTGIAWNRTGQDIPVITKVHPTCNCMDSLGRRKCLNMCQFNSHFGCPFCDHFGVFSAGSMRYPFKSHPDVPQPHLRIDTSFREDMLKAFETKSPVKGIVGPTELINLDNYDMVDGWAFDDLHPIYEGVAQFHTDLLMTTVGSLSEAQKVKIVDKTLLGILTPSQIARKPVSIGDRAKWKGSEWRNWLLYYAIPCLTDVVPKSYLDHFEMLSDATYLLSQDVITPGDIDSAEKSLKKYVELFEEKFGLGSMRFNVHLLTHAAACVRNWGPFWAYSTFNFESWNFKLLQCVKSANASTDQIINRHLISVHLSNAIVDDSLPISREARDQLSVILHKSKRKDATEVGPSIYAVGKKSPMSPTPDQARLIFEEIGVRIDENTDVFEYSSLILKSTVYSIASRKQEDSRSDDSVIYTWDNTFCTIDKIVVVSRAGESSLCGLFVTEHDVDATPNKHIVLQKDGDLPHFLIAEKIHCPAVKITANISRTYLTPMANTYDID